MSGDDLHRAVSQDIGFDSVNAQFLITTWVSFQSSAVVPHDKGTEAVEEQAKLERARMERLVRWVENLEHIRRKEDSTDQVSRSHGEAI